MADHAGLPFAKFSEFGCFSATLEKVEIEIRCAPNARIHLELSRFVELILSQIFWEKEAENRCRAKRAASFIFCSGTDCGAV